MNDLKLSPAQKAMLEAPLDAGRIAKRQGRGAGSFDYLPTFDVIDAANRIFGFDGWSYEVRECRLVHEIDNGAVLYRADVSVTALGVTRQDIGFCDSRDSSPAAAHDMAAKGAISDGLKRALRTFGNQFGNCLYDKETTAIEGEHHQPAKPAPNGGKDNSAYEAAKNLYAELNINADDFATIKGLTGGRPFAIVKEAHEHGCKNGAQVIAYIESGVIPA